jgi:hypothetical protein
MSIVFKIRIIRPGGLLWYHFFRASQYVTCSLFTKACNCLNEVCLSVAVSVSKSATVKDVQDVFLMSEMGGKPRGRFVSIWTEETCPDAHWSVIGQLDGRTSVTFNWTTDVPSTDDNQPSNVTFR